MPNQPQEGLERAMGEAKKQASHVADAANTAARRTANSFETAARELIENQPALQGGRHNRATYKVGIE
jgi:hypothetical protein